jgi:hypothetical protein
MTGRGLDQEDLFFDRRGRLDQNLCRRLDGGGGMSLQHRTQRSAEQVPEHPLRRRGVRRRLSLPARHVGQNLRGEADEVEESLGEIGGSVGLREGERPGTREFRPLQRRLRALLVLLHDPEADLAALHLGVERLVV